VPIFIESLNELWQEILSHENLSMDISFQHLESHVSSLLNNAAVVSLACIIYQYANIIFNNDLIQDICHFLNTLWSFQILKIKRNNLSLDCV